MMSGEIGETYIQWITLFDDQGNFENDSPLQDDDKSKIKFEITVTKENWNNKSLKSNYELLKMIMEKEAQEQ
jgi:hypothetical protein